MLLLPTGACVELKVPEYKLSEKAGSARDGDYFSMVSILVYHSMHVQAT